MSDSDAAPLQEIVHNDVWRALSFYLKYENEGRPFFLAGHSQGSMILTDLLIEHWGSTGAEKLLVAAYPHFTSAQIVDGGLIVQPENIALVTVQGGHFPEGVYHAFDYSLFFENLKANIAERIDVLTNK